MYFRFSDSDMATNAWSIHVGTYDTSGVSDTKVTTAFAGIVCAEGIHIFVFLETVIESESKNMFFFV